MMIFKIYKLLYGISKNHAFIDGNKRTAVLVANLYTMILGCTLVDGDIHGLVTEIVLDNGNASEEIALIYIKEIIKPITDVQILNDIEKHKIYL